MKHLLLTFIALLSVNFAFSIETTSLASCREMLGGSKGKVSGAFKFAKDLQLLDKNETYKAGGILKLPLKAKIKADREVKYSFNSESFLLTSPGGIKIDVGPLVVTVPWVSYDKKTGKFELGTKLIGQNYDSVSDEIATQLEQRIGPTLKAGLNNFFKLITTTDDPEIIKTGIVAILKSFATTDSDDPLPDYIGYGELFLEPGADCRTKLGPLYATIKKDQTIRTKLSFRGTDEVYKTTGVTIFTDQGCFPLSIIESTDIGGCIQGISFSEESGFQLSGINDLDVAASTLKLLINYVDAQKGKVPTNQSCDCNGVGAQEFLDAAVLEKIKKYVRENFNYLKEYGFSEKVLVAILEDNTSGINYLEFSDYNPLPNFKKEEDNKSKIISDDFCLSC